MKLWESTKLLDLILKAYKKNSIHVNQERKEEIYAKLDKLEDPRKAGFLFMLAKKQDTQALDTELNLI